MWNKIKLKFDDITPAQAIVSFYFIAVTVSVLLLRIPAVYQKGVKVTLLDTIFTAISSVSVTGLTVINISETYSVFGIFVLMFVFQFGGIGVMSLGTFFWLIIGKKIGLRGRQLIMIDHNQTNLAGLVVLIREIFKIILIIEVIGAIVLSIHFLQYYPTFSRASLHGLFASISVTTNAGLDITGLFTKITTLTFAALLFFGTIMILLLETQHYFNGMSWHKAFFYAFFQSATTRSGGLAPMDVSQFSEPTLLLISLLMFIGASPSSVGGGIRTTTLALNILFIIHFARGKRNIKIFKREIHEEDIFKALAVTILAFFICFVAIILLSISEQQSLLAIIFEVCSAFGTTGLSMGITEGLTEFGKWVIMILMFIGRIGLVSAFLLMRGKEQDVNYHYPKERIIIG